MWVFRIMIERTLWRNKLRLIEENLNLVFHALIAVLSLRVVWGKSFFPLWKTFIPKVRFISYFYNISPNFSSWFSRFSLSRDQIELFCRIRSNHYNLNYILHKKNIVRSVACSCGDPRQDNHVIFYCPMLPDIDPDI